MHRSRAFIVVILSLSLCLGLAAPALGVTNSDIRKHQDAADQARKLAAEADSTANELAKEVERLDARIEDLQHQANSLNPKIALATKRTHKLKGEVQKLRGECESTQREIDETQATYDVQRELLAQRVEASYKRGTWFYLDVLLGSQDIGDLISRTELVNRTIEANNSIAANLEQTRDTLTDAKTQLDRSLEQMTLKSREAAEVEGELRDLRAARQSRVNAQQAAQNQKAGLVASNRKNAKRLRALAEAEEAESDRLASMLSGNGSGRFVGSMAWPVPASHRITSNFGMRICPFHGRELHPGIDIGRPTSGGGWPASQRRIVAAGKGKVLYAGYRGGYGNTVIIDHGNGVTTLYAHQAPGGIKVSSGQSVSKGQRIGTVGTTGSSTGLHLHFEVRVNGTPKNPLSYR
jgi:murein DD-endopeptidase MepM/ murein hydrolase activator NlpD